MTPFVNEATRSLLDSGAWLRQADLILVVVLMALVVEREILRAYLGEGASRRLRPFVVPLVGLLPAFAVLAVARMVGSR